MLPELQQPGLGPDGRVVEVGMADRAEQDGVRGPGRLQRLVGDGGALVLQGRAPDPALLVADLDAEMLRREVHHGTGGPDHLGAYPVAR